MSSCFEKPRQHLRRKVKKLVVVAREGYAKDWAAYVGKENYGSKLPYAVACVLFPDFDRDFKWRP